MPAFSPSPTVDQVVASLNRSTPPTSVPARLAVFHPLSLLLAFLVVVLLAGFLVLCWNLVRHFENLVVDIRDHRARIAASSQMPAIRDDHLIDTVRFAKELASAPHRAAILHLQRARLLARRGNDADATGDYLQTLRLNPRLITVDDRLEWARILAQGGQRDQAMGILRPIDGSTLDEPRSQRLADILLGLLVTSRCLQDQPPRDDGPLAPRGGPTGPRAP